jgi:16S rRNA processing protein RimM
MTSDESEQRELVQVGETGSAHGIDGEIRIFTARPHWEYFEEGGTLFLKTLRDPDPYTIASWRVADEFAIAAFEWVDDRTAAEQLTNLEVYVEAGNLPDLEDREFYHYDLEGREVFVAERDGDSAESSRRVGEAEGIFETGANDVLVVELEDGDELYVPMVEGAIAEMEVGGERILLRPLETWAPDGTDI